MKDKDQMVILF